MEELDKTGQLVSIQLLENILSDTNTFFNFVSFDRNRDLFPYSLDDYITRLNQYVQYMIRENEQLNSTQLERINIINKVFHKNYPVYTKDVYYDRTQKLIPISILKSLLTDEEMLNRFLDFNNNRNLFPLNFNDYVDAITNYIDTMKNYYISFSNVYKEHFDKIMEFSMVLSNGYSISSNVIDHDLEEKLFENIPKEYNGLSLARAIYVELAKIVQYDDLYLATNNHDDKENIYKQNVDTITLTNNKITCKTWAELYSAILNKYGIQAVVNDKEYHKKVMMTIDNYVITADATNSFIHEQDSMRLCDITRIKLGLNTCGFTSAIPQFENILHTIDSNLIQNAKLEEKKHNDLLQLYRLKFMKNNERIKSLQNKIFHTDENKSNIHKKIHQAIQNIFSKNLDYTSAICYINQYLRINLTPEERLYCNYCIVRVQSNNNFNLNILVEIKENNNDEFFLYQEGKGLVKINNSIIDNLIETEQMTSIHSNHKLSSMKGMIS